HRRRRGGQGVAHRPLERRGNSGGDAREARLAPPRRRDARARAGGDSRARHGRWRGRRGPRHRPARRRRGEGVLVGLRRRLARGRDARLRARRRDGDGRPRRASLPPDATVGRPERRTETVDKMVRAFRVNLTALGLIALLVGVYFVYNTLSISVLRRRAEIGTVRALGASARAVFAVFLAEGA